MTTINNSYPVFEANQVLTSSHLNNLRKYLIEQDKVSRSHLLGIGIVCGMHISNPEKDSIFISKGIGITSKGFLVETDDSLCKYFRRYTDKTFEEPACLTQVQGKYDPFINDDGSQVALWELFTEEEFKNENDSHILPLGSVPVSEMIKDLFVLIYLEIFDHKQEDCLSENCDKMGVTRYFKIRKLLIGKNDLLHVLIKGGNFTHTPTEDELQSTLNAKYYMKEVCIARLGFDTKTTEQNFSLKDYKNFTHLFNAYRRVIVQGIWDVSHALYQSYEAYKPLLEAHYQNQNPFLNYDSERPVKNPLYQQVSHFLSNNFLTVQYVYDYLKDLVNAYNEFRETAFKVITKCCPDTKLFPRHLLLGRALVVPSYDPPFYRHGFIDSPILNSQAKLAQKALILHLRIVKLVNSFNKKMLEFNKIKITPSKPCPIPLGEKAIPYYYEVKGNNDLYRYWNYNLAIKYHPELNLSYHSDLYYKPNEEFVLNPVEWDYCKYDFLRLEGHVGQKYETAITEVINKVEKLNLPVKVVGLKLSSVFDNTGINIDCGFADMQKQYEIYNRELKDELKRKAETILSTQQVMDGGREEEPRSPIPDTDSELEKNMLQPDSAKIGSLRTTASEKNEIGTRNFLFEKAKEKTIGKIYEDITSVSDSTMLEELVNIYSKGDLGTISPGLFTFQYMYPLQLAEKIEVLITGINDELYGLDIEKVEADYDSIKEIANSYLKELTDFVNNPQSELQGFEYEIIRVVKELIDGAGIKRILNLYNDSLEKTNKVKELNLFSNFAERHPGMEHLAGVRKGGTFVVVYCDKNEIENQDFGKSDEPEVVKPTEFPWSDKFDLRKDIPEKQAVEERKKTTEEIPPEYSKLIGRIEEEVKKTGESKSLESRIGEILNSENITSDKYTNSLIGEILNKDEHPDKPYDVSSEFFGAFRPAPEIPKPDVVPNNIVVADFTLPYICCGNCPEIAMVVVSPSSFRLPKDEFCFSDNNEYQFIMEPKGGTVHGPGITQNGDICTFNPSKVVSETEEVQFSYLINNQTIYLKVKLYRPLASFEIIEKEVNYDGSVKIQIVNESYGADSYQFDFGDGSNVSMESNPEHIYRQKSGSVLNIKLIAKRRNCSNSITLQYTIPEIPEVTFGFPLDYVCKNQSEKIPFNVSVKDGVVRGPGVEKTGNTYFLNPGSEEIVDELNTYVLELPRIENKELTVSILNPVAGFKPIVGDYNTETNSVIVKFKNTSSGAKTYSWDFGDDGTSNFKNPEHEYFKFPDDGFEVTLLAKNKDCTDITKQRVLLPGPSLPEVELKIEPKEFCNNDKECFVIDTFPKATAENQVVGDGVRMEVKDNNTIFLFCPFGLAPGFNTLTYRDKTVKVMVYKAPSNKFNEKINNTSFGAIVNFHYSDENIENIHWDFGDKETSEEVNPVHEYHTKEPQNFIIKVRVKGQEGCETEIRKGIKVIPQLITPGIIDTNDIYLLANNNLSLDTVGDRNILVDDSIEYYSLIKNELTNTAKLKAYTSGTKNDEIAERMGSMINSTFDKIYQFSEADNKNEQDYLIQYFKYHFENLMSLTSRQDKDIKAGSKIALLFEEIESNLGELAGLNVDVNPGKEIGKFLETEIKLIPDKPVLAESLKKIMKAVG